MSAVFIWIVPMTTAATLALGYACWRPLRSASKTRRRGTGPTALCRPALDADWCIRFSRRTERRMSLVRIALPHGRADSQGPMQRERILAMLGSHLRCTDIVEVEADDTATVDVYCLDTDKPQAKAAAARLRLAIARHDEAVYVAVSTFPEDGYTLVDLVQAAQRRLHQDAERFGATGSNPLAVHS